MLVGYESSSEDEKTNSQSMKVSSLPIIGDTIGFKASPTSLDANKCTYEETQAQLRKPASAKDAGESFNRVAGNAKKRNKAKARRKKLPLLEEPLSVDGSSSSEDDVAKSKQAISYKRHPEKKKIGTFSTGSLWEENDLVKLRNQEQLRVGLVGGPALPEKAYLINDYKLVDAQTQNVEPDCGPVKSLDTQLEIMLSEGRSIEEIEGLNIIQISGKDISEDARKRRERKKLQDEHDKAFGVQLPESGSLDGRIVTGAMKRKNQLIATALAAQQMETAPKRKR